MQGFSHTHRCPIATNATLKLQELLPNFISRLFQSLGSEISVAVPQTPSNLIQKPFRTCKPFDPDHYDILVKSCNSLKTLKQIHSSLLTTQIIHDCPHLGAQIIVGYSKFGLLDSARSLFGAICRRNSFIWNTMIRIYAKSGLCEETLKLYSCMHEAGIQANNFTFPFVLKACAVKSQVWTGKLVHSNIIRTGFESDLFVEAGLVDMYAKCGLIDDARQVFDKMPERDIVSWTAMITGYEQSDCAEESLTLFSNMQEEGFAHDFVTIVSLVSAVAQLGAIEQGKSIHAHIIRKGFGEEVTVGNSLVAMYAKCGEVDLARSVFDGMEDRDFISWNSMIAGYTQNGHGSEALLLFDRMQVSGITPNSVTALIVVSACSYLGSLQLGRKIHRFIINNKIELDLDTTLWNSVIDMYAKCGDLETAIGLFNSRSMSNRNVSSWNVMISGYGIHGHGREAIELFLEMREQGFKPDHITFTCLLFACSHAGLVNEGRKCFNLMKNELSMTPTVKHYACMVDMLGRAGYLDEARGLITEMPSKPNDSVWGALLGACRIYRNMDLGEFAAKNLFQLESQHTGYYVLMSNIYAASSKWEEVGKLRKAMRSKGLKKPSAFSLIEFGKEVHGFHTSDQSHPIIREIYAKIDSIISEIKSAGYVPDLLCVLHDIEEEDKEQSLKSHSEKLAVAFGIMSIDAGLPIQVTKNLRVCNDCHSVFKFVSEIFWRKIVVRDANRFHHFQEGACSCKDFW